MTEENYTLPTASPRQAPTLTAPKFSSKMAVEFTNAEQKVAAAVKRRKQSSKDVELLAKSQGEYPPTILKLMHGIGIEDGTGFNSIALQVGITSNALGTSEDDMLEASADLIENHKSDGTRSTHRTSGARSWFECKGMRTATSATRTARRRSKTCLHRYAESEPWCACRALPAQ